MHLKHSSDQELIYQLDGRPSLGVAVPLGLQHVLAMFTGNLAPILIDDSMCYASIWTYHICSTLSY